MAWTTRGASEKERERGREGEREREREGEREKERETDYSNTKQVKVTLAAQPAFGRAGNYG